MPDPTALVTKTDFNDKVTENEKKILTTCNLVQKLIFLKTGEKLKKNPNFDNLGKKQT